MKQLFTLSCGLILFFTSLTSSAQTFTPKYTTAIGSNITGYYEYLPQGYGLPENANKRYPIIFYFHGGTDLGNSNGNNNDLERLKKNGIPLVIAKGAMPAYFTNGTDTFQYIIICPQFKNDYPQSDAALVIDYIMGQTSTYRIDAGKVYLTGFSLGGRATWQYLMNSLTSSKKIAAALPIAQYCFPAPSTSFTINPAQAAVAIWSLHNSNDQNAPPATCGTPYVNAFNSYNPSIPAKITIDCMPNAANCAHLDTMPNHIYNPSLYVLPGFEKSIYHWFYQYRQLAAGYPPTANAGPDQFLAMPATGAQLNASASSDVDGTITNYLWKKLSGPLSCNINNSSAATTAITNLVHGAYSFELTVIDNQGFVAKDTTVINVNNPNPNQLPIASAGADAEIFLPNNAYNLNSNGSIDNDGDIETYQWQKLSGPASYAISNMNIVSPVISNLTKGLYSFQLKVTDNQNGISYDTVLIKVTSTLPNIAPVANAGPDQLIVLPNNSASLTGTGSDADGSITAYAWTKVAGPSAFNIISASSANTSITSLVEGFYSFELAVTDDSNAVRKDTVNITVSASQRILIDLGAGSLTASPDASGKYWNNMTDARPGVRVQNAKTTSNGSSTLNLEVINRIDGTYNTGGTGLGTGNSTGAVSDYPATATTDYAFTYTGTNNGQWKFTGLDSLRQYTIKFWGTKSDVGPRIIEIKRNDETTWKEYECAGNTDYNRAAIFTFSGKTSMTFDIRAKAASQFGYINVVDISMVSLGGTQTNVAPIARAGNDVNINLPTNSISLNGAASSDADGSIVSYRWKKINGPAAGSITDSTASITTVTGLVQGNYNFELTVTDNSGAVGKDTVAITVGATANVPPIARAGADINITLPTNNTLLNGSASTDNDGSIISYRWKKISGPSAGTITDSTTANTTLTGLTQGNYNFELTVIDNSSAIGKDTVAVNVAAAGNVAPVAKAGVDINVTLPTNTASLNGSTSIDSDGSIVLYRWKKIAGSTATITDSTAVTTSVTNLVQGGFQFELTVTDNSGGVGKDTVAVNVASLVNSLPIARAGNDIVITHPQDSVTVDGSASSDPDGTISAYAWTKINGPTEFQIANATSSSSVIRNLKAGTYNFELKVTDNSGGIGKDTIAIVVNSMPMPAPTNTDVASCNKAFKIVVLGSSTSFGTGATPIDSSYVNKYEHYIKTKNSQSQIINLALGGYTTYQVLNPTGFTPPLGRPTPDSLRNITKALSYAPDAIIINMPSNDVASAFPNVEQKANYEKAIALANAAGVPVFVTTTQPRNSLNNNQYDSLKEMRDWTLSRFGTKAVDFWTPLATSLGTIVNVYDYDDVHVNNYGHYIFFTRMVAAKILDTICNRVNVAPVAIAGNDTAIIFPSSTVNLKGSISFDSDGFINAYQWTKISGPSAGVISNNTLAQTTATGLVKGTYFFELKVTDNYGAVGRDTMRVIVSSGPNIPPVANAGPDQFIILPGNTVSLIGSGSDVDGLITTYAWTKIAGPINFGITTASSATTSVTGLTEGFYSFELAVKDDSNAIKKDTVNITVTASQRILIDVGAASLTASPDVAGKYWNNMTDARAGVRVQNAKTTTNVSTTVNLEVINRIDGSYNTGGTGLSTGNTTGAVSDYPTTATTDYAFAYTGTNNGQWKFSGLDSLRQYSIKFWGTKSDLGPRVIEIKRNDQTTWLEYEGANNSDYNRAAVFTFSGKTSMTFDIRAKSASQFGYINVVDIAVVSTGNQPPVANAGADRTIVLPKDSVVLAGNNSYDPEGGVLKYKWTKISGPAAYQLLNDSIASPAVMGLQQGIYQFELKVTDNGLLISKDSIVVTVNAAPQNIAPVARAGSDVNIALPNNSAALNGSSSTDADGSIVLYRWRKMSGPASGSISDSTTASTNAINLVQGVYNFELTVTDNNAATGKDTMIVTVTPAANIPPIARAGADFVMTLPVNSINLNGSASSDADGTISYLWSKISGPTQFAISDATASQPLISNLVQAVYGWELKVTDNVGAISRDTVLVTVNAAQQSVARQRVLIDVGPDNNNSGQQVANPDAMGKYWNYLTDGRPGVRVSNAVDSSNIATGLGVEVINRIDGTSPISPIGMNFINNVGIIGDYPAAATYDNAFANNSATNGQWKITGLDPAKTYSVKFWGTRSSSGARIIQIKKNTDATFVQEYDATGNTDYNRAAIITNITGVTEQIFDIRVKPGYEYGNISVMDIIITSPLASGRTSGNSMPALIDNPATTSATTPNTNAFTEQDNQSQSITIYPNPFKDDIVLNYSGKEIGKGLITIFNANMKIVKTISIDKNARSFQQHINLSATENGLYFIRLRIGSVNVIQKIVK